MKLNVGCGRDIRPGWINIDQHPNPGIDLVAGLDHPAKVELPYLDDTAETILASHLIEHLHHPLPLLEELWRIAKPGCVLTVRAPHGASDNADEDPTHVRRLYPLSFAYFSQPAYWRADYGYRGDWQPEHIVLKVADPNLAEFDDTQLLTLARYQRNTVAEMIATLRAIKPARPTDPDLREPPSLRIERVK